MFANLNLLKSRLFYLLITLSMAVLSCVDDNDDTQAPYLEVSPLALSFTAEGMPVVQGGNGFAISTNRSWTATVQQGKSWVSLSQSQGSGDADIQVSIPKGINDEASVIVEISNKAGVLMSQAVTIKSGDPVPGKFTMTSSDIVSGATGSVALLTNSYGSQSVDVTSSWYTWNSYNIVFTGVRMCVATEENGGGIQLQGNASDATKQGRLANVTPLGSLSAVVVTTTVPATSTFAPAYTLYAGAQANPLQTDITPTMVMTSVEGFNKYVWTFDLSGGDYSYFNIVNNKAGAIYIESVMITLK